MNTFLQHVWSNKFAFLITFFLVFSFTYVVFVAFDFLPEEHEQAELKPQQEVSATLPETTETTETTEITQEVEVEPVVQEQVAIYPTSINIAKLDKTIAVMNPVSRTIADLDAALLEGAVRHPDSATLAQDGNVFLLGHSSYLPNVFNKNFQAFNGIQNLEWGDIIELETADAIYEYRVEKVYRARAQDVTVPIAGTGKMLTMATCNSFGSIDDRFIVEAKQVNTRTI